MAQDHQAALQALKTLKAEKDILLQRIAKMEEMKTQVKEQVFARVSADYQQKLQSIEDQREPLKNQVRQEYQAFKKEKTETEQLLDQLNLQKEEWEFRQQLGEFEGQQERFSSEMERLDLEINESLQAKSEADALDQQYLSVFDSREDLESPPSAIRSAPVPLHEEKPEPPAAQVAPPADAYDTVLFSGNMNQDDQEEGFLNNPQDMAKSGSIPPPPHSMREDIDSFDVSIGELDDESPVISHVEGLDDLNDPAVEDLEDQDLDTDQLSDIDDQAISDADRILDDKNVETLPGQSFDKLFASTPDVPPPPPSLPDLPDSDVPELPPIGFDDDMDGTMIISNPQIVALHEGREGQSYSLGMKITCIGRSPDNEITITEDRVSRFHAQIEFGPEGYKILDRKSENGTFVNDNRVSEKVLEEGDIIQVGYQKFRFKTQ
jgi:hypothetical protein